MYETRTWCRRQSWWMCVVASANVRACPTPSPRDFPVAGCRRDVSCVCVASVTATAGTYSLAYALKSSEQQHFLYLSSRTIDLQLSATNVYYYLPVGQQRRFPWQLGKSEWLSCRQVYEEFAGPARGWRGYAAALSVPLRESWALSVWPQTSFLANTIVIRKQKRGNKCTKASLQ